MEFTFVKTKLIPEQKLPSVISRPRLTQLLGKNFDKNLICLCARAGYGKTTLVNDFLYSSKLNNCWYKIDKEDDNFYLFVTYLASSIQQKYKNFGKTTFEILDSIKSRTNIQKNLANVLNTVLGTFINDFISNVTQQVYLVLDDFHRLPNEEWVKETMNYLIKNIPSNLHIIVTTREIPNFDTGYIQGKRKYFELTTEELKFNEEETKRLFSDTYEKHIPGDVAKEINDKFDGWITALHLFVQSEKSAEMQMELNPEIPDSIYSLFAEDIYASKNENIRYFLIHTCFLDSFTATDCNHLLDISNSDSILRELFLGNVFINRQDTSDESKLSYSFVYQELFRQFLVRKFYEQKTSDEQKEHFRKIASYYLLAENYNDAIKFYCMAGEYTRAIDLILKKIPGLLREGDLNLPNKWLKYLPDEIKDGNPYILYYIGSMIKNFYGDLDLAFEYFTKASNLIKNTEDRFFVRANTQIFEIYINQGKTDKALEGIKEFLKLKLNKESEADLLFWEAVCHYNYAEYETALSILHKALDIAAENDLRPLKNEISNQLGNIYLIRGEFAKSLFHYENVLNHFKNVYHKFQTLTNIVQLYAYSGQFDKAKQTLDEAYEMQSLFPTTYFRMNYYIASAHLSYLVCDYEKCLEQWIEVLSIAKKGNFSYYSYMSYVNSSACYYYLGEKGKAGQFYDLAGEFVSELNEIEKIDYDFTKAVMNKSSLTDETGKILKESYDYFDKHNLIYNKVQAGFHYADFLFKKDKIIEVKKYLEEVFHIIAEKEYVAIIIPEIFTDRAIFDFAIENDINKQFIQQVLVSAVGIKNILWLSEHNKKRITEAVEKLYDIKLECLGGLNIRLRGELISDDKWIRKVRKLIFAYIMLNYKKNITKDNIIELFYPESAPENADNIFHQTISNIRSAIKPSSSEKHPPTYLNYSEKMFQFNPYYFYNIDAYEFEDLFKKITARTTQKSDKKPLLMRAIEIYKGPFLEGYYQDWVEKLREKYSEMFITLLEELIELMKEEGNYQEVIACCEKLLSVDNLNEDVYVNIIESHLRLGNKPAARKVNRQLTAAMKKEFDSPPSKETLKKIETLFSQ